ncbi:MAG TPA: M23 family metallopeptidase [Candidatus Methylomirabilis sp.]|nr:M23 family metallopeptidase [Candidatus Methylomirabilis sp.]
MARSRIAVRLALIGIPILLIVGVVSYLAWRQSVPLVRAELSPPKFIGLKTPLTLNLEASRGGVRSAEVALVQGSTRAVVAAQTFPDPVQREQRLSVTVAGKELGLHEGAASLEVRARDGFWRPIRRDDRPIASVPVTIDLTPPSLEVLAATHYLHQGGGGLAALRVKGAAHVGVRVGEVLFPAYPVGAADSGLAVALFALPWDLPDVTTISAWAEDEAGNSVSNPLPAELQPRRFSWGTVELTEQFLASKLPELLPERGAIPRDQYGAAFLTVNRDLRKKAEEVKRRLAARTGTQPLWEGPFIQPRNTKVFSNFAESRSYRYDGQEVGTAVHLGFDLASLKHSPVPAANAGVVVFAGPLTIYGNAVVLDHGLGLQTLYGHLSSIAVKEGDKVTQGQELGRTGTTGLAVGDHLHYEVVIGGVSVTPVEWWDGKWIRDHIGRPLSEANVPLLQSEFPTERSKERPPASPTKKHRAARSART